MLIYNKFHMEHNLQIVQSKLKYNELFVIESTKKFATTRQHFKFVSRI